MSSIISRRVITHRTCRNAFHCVDARGSYRDSNFALLGKNPVDDIIVIAHGWDDADHQLNLRSALWGAVLPFCVAPEWRSGVALEEAHHASCRKRRAVFGWQDRIYKACILRTV